ncbi:MAG: hydroxychlorobactene glucosyltransferase CruC [Vulcanimicrobiaceae bacterium]
MLYAARCATFAASWRDAPLLARAPEEPLPMLSIVVPARDDARLIERCVRSLLDFELIVVDDRSTDATPEILARMARDDARLQIVRGEPMPDGWIGKPWALVQGVARARGSWFLFTDADSHHAPAGSASVLWLATRAGLDAISIATHQELGSFWERAVLPSILGLILFASGPLADINDPAKPKSALANGQYLLVARHAYEALGGHAALRGEIVEDVAFARRIKEDGRFRFALLGGARIASVRMYRSLGEIWAGFTKNVYIGARGDLRALAGGTAFVLAISIAPPLLAVAALVRRRYGDALEASLATVTIVATASWAMRLVGFPRRLALLQPLGTALFAGIVATSTASVVSGRGVVWRGRTYHAAPEKATLANERKPAG